jgi:hypothetical protein
MNLESLIPKLSKNGSVLLSRISPDRYIVIPIIHDNATYNANNGVHQY